MTRKSGIKIVWDEPGDGAPLSKGDRVRLRYSIQLNRGDFLAENHQAEHTVGDRNWVAGFRYGLEGMRIGGSRQFRAAPHLCYGDREWGSVSMGVVPKNAVLVVTIHRLSAV